MNAGKSTQLLQADFNYRERGMRTLLFSPLIDTRSGAGEIRSRVGISAVGAPLAPDENLFELVKAEHAEAPVACVLVDEAQFLSPDQVWQACKIADGLDIPVLCYGLRTDFQGKLFPGSGALLALADTLQEVKTICACGRKATMNLRMGPDGVAVKIGEQVAIGGNERYVAMCRKHFCEALAKADRGVAAA